jgi:hypothetical protein
MFTDIFDIVLARQTSLDGVDLCNLRCVSKDVCGIIDWGYVSRLYRPRTTDETRMKSCEGLEVRRCDTCWKETSLRIIPTFAFRCVACQKVVTLKNACHKFKLTSEDTAGLTKFKTHFGHLGVSIRSVVGIALLKHGGPARLKLAMTPKRMLTKAFKVRTEKLKMLELRSDEVKYLKPILDKYIRNGKGGLTEIKRLRWNLKRYDEIERALPEHLKAIAESFPHLRSNFVRWHQSCDYLRFQLLKQYATGS